MKKLVDCANFRAVGRLEFDVIRNLLELEACSCLPKDELIRFIGNNSELLGSLKV